MEAVTGVELAVVIEGRREDWPGRARTLMPRYPTREPNGTFWFGAELPAGDQVWFRIAEEAIGRMPEKIDRGGRRNVARSCTDVGWRDQQGRGENPCHHLATARQVHLKAAGVVPSTADR